MTPTIIGCFVIGCLACTLLGAVATLRQPARPKAESQSEPSESAECQQLLARAEQLLEHHSAELDLCERELDAGAHAAADTFQRASCGTTAEQLSQTADALDHTLSNYGDTGIGVRRGLLAYASSVKRIGQLFLRLGQSDSEKEQLRRMIREMHEENARLNAETHELHAQIDALLGKVQRASAAARVDPLTRLPNRRAWNEQARAMETARVGCFVALMDLDDFKTVNDVHGHLAGDAVLQLLARVLRETPGIIAFRSGGDEFTILVETHSSTVAENRLEQVREKVQTSTIQFKSHKLTVTVSIGYAQSQGGNPIKDALEHADIALYEAKDSGRNTVCGYKASIQANTPAHPDTPAPNFVHLDSTVNKTS